MADVSMGAFVTRVNDQLNPPLPPEVFPISIAVNALLPAPFMIYRPWPGVRS